MKKLIIMTMWMTLAFAEEPVAEQQIAMEVPTLTLPADAPAQETVPIESAKLVTEDPPANVETIKASTIETEPSINPETLADPEADIAAIEKEEKDVAAEVKSDGIIIDLNQVFSGSPTIYTVLFFLSISALGIGLYAFASLRTPELLPDEPLHGIREKLIGKQYDQALAICNDNHAIIFKMVAAGIQSRNLGASTMHELMKAEGKRESQKLWQRISLLNDIAVIAPMLGLLGTVLGMFYAFYDLNRSTETISALFDGLGISVGTTVGGLVVAIIALFFHTMTKQRLMQQLVAVESQSAALANLIDTTEDKQ